jgi:CRISPR-associated exonuclease Cas4
MDEVQLCAQALCLEEMLGVTIAEGSLFYGEPRRRTAVVFDGALRSRVERLIARLHELTRVGVTPLPVYAPKCKSCSLLQVCEPKVTGGKSAKQYMKNALRQLIEDSGSG